MSNLKSYKVYIHTFPNGKHYVGITQQEPMRRWHGGCGYEGQSYISNAIKKYGWQNVYHTILYDELTKEEAEEKEIELIKLLKSNDRNYGYNIANGGFCRGAMSEETKAKISEMRKGIVFSEEHIKNLSESHKGIVPSEQQKYKDMMSNPKRKVVLCVETGITYNSIREAGRKTGINYRNIGEVCNCKYGRKTAGGFSWRFIEKGVD